MFKGVYNSRVTNGAGSETYLKDLQKAINETERRLVHKEYGDNKLAYGTALKELAVLKSDLVIFQNEKIQKQNEAIMKKLGIEL